MVDPKVESTFKGERGGFLCLGARSSAGGEKDRSQNARRTRKKLGTGERKIVARESFCRGIGCML